MTTNTMNGLDEDASSASLEWLIAALENDECDEMIAEDILNAPKSQVLEYLESEGIPEREPLERYGLTLDDLARLEGELPPAADVSRPVLLGKIHSVLGQSTAVVIYGPNRSGKSTLVQSYLRDARAKTRYQKSIVLDCFAIRGKSLEAIDREAIWSLYSDDAEVGKSFLWPADAHSVSTEVELSDLTTIDYPPPKLPSNDGPFLRYMRSGTLTGGLLILDHAERLPPSPETTQWMSLVVEEGGKHAISVVLIFSAGSESDIPHQKALRNFPRIHVPDLTKPEIAAWLGVPSLAVHRKNGLNAKWVHLVTGGRPGLVRDLDRFLKGQSQDCIGWRALARFSERQSESYSVECDLLIQALRIRPDFMMEPLRVSTTRIRSLMIRSGAVTVDSTSGSLRFTSPIFARRYKFLMEPKHLLWMSAQSDVASILSRVRFFELVGMPLNEQIISEDRPHAAFARLVQVVAHFGFREVSVHIRDRQNARLWSLASRMPNKRTVTRGAWPLIATESPDFARAVYTGRRVATPGGKVYLPLVGTNGRVELVVSCDDAGLDSSAYEDRLRLRGLWNVAMALEAGMALAVERLAMRRQVRLHRDMFHRLREADPGRGAHLAGTLREAHCSAVIVLERGPSRWLIAQCVETHQSDDSGYPSVVWNELLEQGNAVRLDEVANHPSRRGLVLSGRELANAFPRLLTRSTSVAAFLHPVWLHSGGTCRLVAFLFEGSASRDINGIRQTQLSVMAPYAVAG